MPARLTFRRFGDVLHRYRRRNKHRGNATLNADVPINRLDRNHRVRLLVQARAIDRASKSPGQRSGYLGDTGLEVYRALILECLDRRTGRCTPSIERLCQVTGYCRQTIVQALKRLSDGDPKTKGIRLIRIVRRLVWGPVTRKGVTFDGLLQDVNAYGFNDRPAASLPPPKPNTAKPFPKSYPVLLGSQIPRSKAELTLHFLKIRQGLWRQKLGAALSAAG